ncbi:centromere kinetochore component CENP-T domain-containing protein [Rutstroemia sp. NJR-2017a BVV2]|nr:centromere kinetochore component CENP-T domain-containing protein [Rutstroemia sp. NJR-2017a BVV2]
MSFITVPGVKLHGPPRPRERDGIYNQEEIVSLITRYYELLAKMRYFPESCIKYPPHNPAIDLDVAKELDLEPQVIELLQSLPYVEDNSNEDEFICGGRFADMREPSVLQQSRDPAYASPSSSDFNSEDGPYVRPWELVINECGNRGSIMYLNTRNGEQIGHVVETGLLIMVEDTLRWKGRTLETAGELGTNRHLHDHLPSRHAKELFEDFMNRLLKLEWIPSSEDRMILRECDEEFYDVKLLFLTYGWPNNFDSSGFDDAYVRLREFFVIRSTTVAGARHVMHVLGEIQKAEEDLARHSRRLHDGVWDHDPNKSRSEIRKLERLRRVKTQTLEKIRARFEDVKLASGGWESEEEQIWKTWRKYLEDNIRRAQKDLTYRTGPGSQNYSKEQVSEQEEKVATFKKRLENVHQEPTNVEMAIMPRRK